MVALLEQMVPPMDRLKSNIIKKVSMSFADGCWNFTGCIQSNGYGRMTYKRKTQGAHRWSYIAFVGEIPPGMDVCHSCDNRRCVNPMHLFVGTRKENMQDAKTKGRVATGEKLPQSKISPAQKILIMEKVNSGESYKDIADSFGVTKSSIGRIARLNGVFRYGERNK